jgi:hypothetical protein
MSAQPVEPEVELPTLHSIRTYDLGYGLTVSLCLATHWETGDPQPMICAREKHPDDDRHLTHSWNYCGGRVEQTTWREGS